jgi:uncharacterized protein (DUF169 family)
MSVFKTEEPLEKRVKVLEQKVRQLEVLLGKKPKKEPELTEKEEEEDFCIIS